MTLKGELNLTERMSSSAATMIIAPGVDGQFTILPGHAPLVSLLSNGKLTYRSSSIEKDFLVTGGLIRVENNRVTVLADGLQSK